MKVTVLGSGDATAVPVPLCDCEYCLASERRRHPALLVEERGTTILLDIGPHVQGQLHRADAQSIDAAFLTHAHGDHSGGLPRLYQAAKWDSEHLATTESFEPTPEVADSGYTIYMTETAKEHLQADYEFLGTRLDITTLRAGHPVRVGNLEIEGVTVEHHRPTYETLGYLIRAGETSILYAPDMRRFVGSPPEEEIELCVCEGAALLGQPVHGPKDELQAAIEALNADRTVLVNINEHLQRAHTDELRTIAADRGVELAHDFQEIEV